MKSANPPWFGTGGNSKKEIAEILTIEIRSKKKSGLATAFLSPSSDYRIMP